MSPLELSIGFVAGAAVIGAFVQLKPCSRYAKYVNAQNSSPILAISSKGKLKFANNAAKFRILEQMKDGVTELYNLYVKEAFSVNEKGTYTCIIGKSAYRVHTEPLLNKGICAVYFQDITKEHDLKETWEKAQHKLRVSERLVDLGQMAAGIAHEIKNPIGILTSKITLLKMLIEDEDLDKEEGIELCNTMAETCTRMTRIIQSIKNMSRDGSDDPFELLTLDEILIGSTSYLAPKFRGEGIKFSVEIKTDVKQYIFCREVQINQVITNMLNNAEHAVKRHSDRKSTEEVLPPTIKMEVDQDSEGNVIFYVKDNGYGVPTDIQQKIFQPFYSTKKKEGTGLGLSISQEIAKLHKGEFSLKSSKPGETIFYLKLPISNENC